jgi:23S rRNA pseudouridine1911/1915/1917 synthase
MDVQVVRDSLVVTPDKHQDGRTIIEVCTTDMGLPENYVHQLLGQRRVTIHKFCADALSTLHAGQKVVLEGGIVEPFGVDVANLSNAVVARTIEVLYEDDHVMVVNKPPGLIIYPGSNEDTVTLAHLVARYYQLQGVSRRVRHVHRLDRDTTGAILYAKHSYSARALDAALSLGEVKRTYLALVQGKLPSLEGTIDLPIGRDRHQGGRYRVSPTGKSALTDYKVLDSRKVAYGDVSLVECHLRTGRTHQIRVHFAELGHPVVGDALYGAGTGIGGLTWPNGHALHAWRLAFMHPYEHTWVEVEASVPELFQTAMVETRS